MVAVLIDQSVHVPLQIALALEPLVEIVRIGGVALRQSRIDDLDAAAEGAIVSKYRNMGQTCVCANRLFVHERVYDAFAAKLAAKVAALKVGPGTEPGVMQGPLIDDAALAKVEEHVAVEAEAGALHPAPVEVHAHQRGDVARSRVAAQRGGGALLDDPPLLQDHEPIGEDHGVDGVVGDEHVDRRRSGAGGVGRGDGLTALATARTGGG